MRAERWEQLLKPPMNTDKPGAAHAATATHRDDTNELNILTAKTAEIAKRECV
jgi:hypothetical protein